MSPGPRTPISWSDHSSLDPLSGLFTLRPRPPWLGGDLQTLRDSLRPVKLPRDQGQPLLFDLTGGDQLLGLLDQPLSSTRANGQQAAALVVVLHGLGGGSDRLGVRRLALNLQRSGFAVLRLNLRGAGPGRPWARGTYAASCNSDLLAVWPQLRSLAAGRPLLAVGLSLGGTTLLNALLADGDARRMAGLPSGVPLLDALVCVSSPLDLVASSRQIGRLRNRLYERWLLRRLRRDTLADPGGVMADERRALQRVVSIRDFDAAITAPRWGHASVEDYYRAATVLPRLLDLVGDRSAVSAGERKLELSPTLLLHALDDPWVPAAAAVQLAQAVAALPDTALPPLQVLLTPTGGHNGFHAAGDGPVCSWSDALVLRWLTAQLDS